VYPEDYYSVLVFQFRLSSGFLTYKNYNNKKKHAVRSEVLTVASRAIKEALLDPDKDTTFLRNVSNNLLIDIV